MHLGNGGAVMVLQRDISGKPFKIGEITAFGQMMARCQLIGQIKPFLISALLSPLSTRSPQMVVILTIFVTICGPAR